MKMTLGEDDLWDGVSPDKLNLHMGMKMTFGEGWCGSR